MLQRVVEVYGFPALVVGVFLEGETVMLMGGFLAHRGYLALWVVVAAGVLGGLAADQLSFHLGRRWGARALARRPTWRAHAERVRPLLERRGTAVIVGLRFWVGMRTVVPVILGSTTDVSARRFLALNAIGALAWAVILALAGFAFGHGIEVALDDVRPYEHVVLLGLAAAGALCWMVRRWRARRA